MQAVIMTGGKGVRLQPLTFDLPKPMIPLDDKPILEHVLLECKKHGFDDIILCNGFLHKKIEEYFGDGKKWGIRIRHSNEQKPLGTAGALKDVEDMLEQNFLVLLGDVLFHMDFKRFFDAHVASGAVLTTVVHPNDHPWDSDIVEVDSDMNIKKFHSKPGERWKEVGNLAMAGGFVVKRKFLDYIEKGVKANIEKGIMPKVLEAGEKVHAYNTDEYVKDMGTLDRLEKVRGYLQKFKEEEDKPKKAVFLDRDGVINEDTGFVHDKDKLEFIEGSLDALRKLSNSDYVLVIITNQAGIAKGKFSLDDYKALREHMHRIFRKEGIHILDEFYCPHHPKGSGEFGVGCECRKPSPKMILDAAKKHNIDVSKSFMIGDMRSDILCGQTAGAKAILVKTGFGGEGGDGCEVSPEYVAKNLKEAAEIILSIDKKV